MMENHDVAVTVFATVPGIDASDATNRLERLIMDQLDWDGTGFTLAANGRAGVTEESVPVHTVISATAALGDGYLRATVTNKARRESPHNRKGDH